MEKEVKFFDNIKYDVDYRNVKYPRLEFRTGNLNLILPLNYHGEKKLLNKHERWIKEKEKFISDCLKCSKNKRIYNWDLEELREMIYKKIQKDKIHVKINIKKMKSKWASCSSKKNLTFNTSLKYLPKYLINYIIYHEITHISEKRHNERFWKLISNKFDNYSDKERELFAYWFAVQNLKRKER